MNANKIPGKSSKATHATDATTTHVAHAYVVVIPKPKKGVYGIKRFEDPGVATQNNLKGQYMFWVKIGDAKKPHKRLQKYTNPNQK
ncbi:hypothetical protein FRC07_014008 [Ceratobasidium sp. 392]|nr:hypothetical protein FRC07_014008 [Ceratobasidium sp. 392]